jgi:hypothetical protein
MAIDTGIGISLTQVTTTKQAPLGQTVLQPAGSDNTGEKVWLYVWNNSGSPIAPNMLVARDTGSTNAQIRLCPAGASPARVMGVTGASAIPDGSYGWILRKGIHTVTADATVAASVGAFPDTSTAGNVMGAAADTDQVVGATIAGRTGAGTFSAYINCIG